jgi:polyisoprenoid-binding protein YceI
MRKQTRWMAYISIAAMLVGSLQSVQAQPVTYRIDPVHSFIIFRVKHLNTGFAYGRFNSFSGTIVVDEKNPANSSIELEIDANSVDTGNSQRDDHLRNPDFFNARQFPKITFKSTRVRKINDTTVEVQGDLTMRGVTRPITRAGNLHRQGAQPARAGDHRLRDHLHHPPQPVQHQLRLERRSGG